MKNKIILIMVLLLGLSSSSKVMAQTLHALNKELPCVDRHFNLMIHIMVDSTRELGVSISAIEAAVAGCNTQFAPICASFSVCEVDTIFNYNFDSLPNYTELGEKSLIFDKKNRFDIYIMSELIDETLCGLGGGGEIHLEKGCLGAITHEMGHAWGLPHTFSGNGSENVDGSNCETAGDGICDTPADPFNPDLEDEVYQNGCEFVWLGLDANGQYYQPDMGNIMSYYGCDCGFTRGQYLKMAASIQTSTLW